MLHSLLVRYYRSSAPVAKVMAKLCDFLGNYFKLTAVVFRHRIPKAEQFADEVEASGFVKAVIALWERENDQADEDLIYYIEVLDQLEEIGHDA